MKIGASNLTLENLKIKRNAELERKNDLTSRKSSLRQAI